MKKLVVHQDNIDKEKAETLVKLCSFDAIEYIDGILSINAACKMCQLCVKKGPTGCIELIYEEESKQSVDKSAWKGIAVYVDHIDGEIHPVTYELIGKARELSVVIDQPVYALMMGHNITQRSKEILHYGVDEVCVYDRPELEHFRIEPYTAAFEDFIHKRHPGSILVGATPMGRQLAPRIAARMRSGLTADCTTLEMKEDTDLAQIRPAFGGNIMAQIQTPNNRPQIATVRYKVMNAPKRMENTIGKITSFSIDQLLLKSGIDVLNIEPKEKEETIDTAEVLVVAGRGVKKKEDLAMLEELSTLLGGKLACTRPLIESGWMNPKKQIGLSGRTVRPKLIITCGVFGAIQFVAGMNKSEKIIAINSDIQAPIFNVAHYGLVGDIYEIVPKLIQKIKAEKKEVVAL